jgi:glutamine phosphoribosylpyrophosphate amidotransferase
MCGIVGIVDAGGVSIQLYYSLYALQHRGQESAGISTYDGTNLQKFKGPGLVADVFTPTVLNDLKGNMSATRQPGPIFLRISSLSISSLRSISSQLPIMATL